jgi:antagonist of KipI
LTGLDTFEVLSPGILTTVQDLGRFGYARYGVATSGALDGFAARIANVLVGNPESAAVLETTLMGLRLKAMRDVTVAITGGDLQPIHAGGKIPMWQSHFISKGEVLAFAGPASGLRAYIAVNGGFHAPLIMGSRSTNLSSGFGGLEGRPLRKGDIVGSNPVETANPVAGRAFNREWIPAYPSRWQLRVIWGPQDDEFSDEGRQTLVSAAFSVSPDSDRTGIRLKGPTVMRKPGLEESIISEGILSGAVQIPGDGQPIIILAEIASGGYRKIATVISADLSLLGQITPGDEVQFRAVSPDAAVQALREMEDKIRRFRESLSM